MDTDRSCVAPRRSSCSRRRRGRGADVVSDARAGSSRPPSQRGTTAEVAIAGDGELRGGLGSCSARGRGCRARSLARTKAADAAEGEGARSGGRRRRSRSRLDRRGRRPARARARSASPRRRGSPRSAWSSWSTTRSSPRPTTRRTTSPTGAQALTLPVVVSGTIGKVEDVDWYAVRGHGRPAVTFRVWGNRLENKIHDLQTHFDPILHAPRRARAASSPPTTTTTSPTRCSPTSSRRPGRYLLQVRDTTYAGNANWTYVLQATAGPVATSVFPLAVNPGTTAELHGAGRRTSTRRRRSRSTSRPASPRGPCSPSLPTAEGPTLAVPLVVTAAARRRRGGRRRRPRPSKAQAVALPAAI